MLHLDYRDSRPIYEQVQDGLRRLMVSGVLTEGEKLPSVRALAGQLAINPNTIQRAYEALEREGYVYSVAGKGEEFCWPCGSCRQMLYEFAPDLRVLAVRGDGEFEEAKLSDLLPRGFGAGHLK